MKVLLLVALLAVAAVAVPVTLKPSSLLETADHLTSHMAVRHSQEAAHAAAEQAQLAEAAHVTHVMNIRNSKTMEERVAAREAQLMFHIHELKQDTAAREGLRATIRHAAELRREAEARGQVKAGGLFDIWKRRNKDKPNELVGDDKDKPDFCWVTAEFRGIGAIPNQCSSTQDKIGLLCYDKCDKAYSSSGCKDKSKELTAAGFGCREACPADTFDTPLVCFQKGWNILKAAPKARCGYERYPNMPACSDSLIKSGGLCYTACPSAPSGTGDITAAGPFCWHGCNLKAGFSKCGPLACATSKGKCGTAITSMVFSTVAAGIKIGALVASAGASAIPGFLGADVGKVADLLGNVGTITGSIQSFITTQIKMWGDAKTEKEATKDTANGLVQQLKALSSTLAGASDSTIAKVADFVFRVVLSDEPFSDEESFEDSEGASKSIVEKAIAWFKKPEAKEMAVNLAMRVAFELDPTGIMNVIDAFAWPRCGVLTPTVAAPATDNVPKGGDALEATQF